MSDLRDRGRHEPSGDDVARAVLGSAVGRLLAHDPLARRGHDPEGIHQVRVAARHLRAELRLLTPVLKKRAVDPVRADLRWLGGELGDARDVDVRFAHLRSLLDDRPGADEVAQALAALEDRERTQAAVMARAALASKRYKSLVMTLASMVVDPPVTRLAVVPARGILTPGLRVEAGRLEDAVDALGPDPSMAALHQVRIAVKRLRYGAEVAAQFVGDEAAALGDLLAAIQDQLGDARDAVFAIELLRGLGPDEASPFDPSSDAGRAIEAMIHDEEARIEVAERSWPAAYGEARARVISLGWLLAHSASPSA